MRDARLPHHLALHSHRPGAFARTTLGPSDNSLVASRSIVGWNARF
jgi:hypothetical protein